MKYLDILVMGSRLMFDIVVVFQVKVFVVLDWVGMSEIDVLFVIFMCNGVVVYVVVKVQVYVNLINLEVKGIYMLWFYLLLDEVCS